MENVGLIYSSVLKGRVEKLKWCEDTEGLKRFSNSARRHHSPPRNSPSIQAIVQEPDGKVYIVIELPEIVSQKGKKKNEESIKIT